jgi:uncharacterized membrane protein YcaP (DUF421 family)
MLADAWKLRLENKERKMPLHIDKEDVKHTLLSCPETMKWTMGFLRKQQPNMQNEVIYRQYEAVLVNCWP